MSMASPVHLIGAAGRMGAALCHVLRERGETVVPVVRHPDRLPPDLREQARQADLENADTLMAALADAQRVVSTAHARFIPAILTASPDNSCLVAIGSTRKFTRWPDWHGNGVLAGERALMESGRPGMILHPTMIYGPQGENNVQRLVALLRYLPLVPLPNGGRSLIQPIYQDDVIRSIVTALDLARSGHLTAPEALVIAGPEPMTYRALVEAILAAAGLGSRLFLPVPAAILEFLIPLTKKLPRFPSIERAEVRRLLEDKAFSIQPMQDRLGFTPLPLKDGLARLFGQPTEASPLPAGIRP